MKSAFRMTGVLVATGRILCERSGVSQVDINPVIIRGARPVAVDAMVALDADRAGESEVPS